MLKYSTDTKTEATLRRDHKNQPLPVLTAALFKRKPDKFQYFCITLNSILHIYSSANTDRKEQLVNT